MSNGGAVYPGSGTTHVFAYAALVLCACGASPRMIQQGSVYYEQCQAAELDPERNVDQRRECWTAWMAHYSTGQPLEKRAYAQERRIALAHGDELQALPDGSMVSMTDGRIDNPIPTESQSSGPSTPSEPLDQPDEPPASDVADRPAPRPSPTSNRFFAVREPEDVVPAPPPRAPELEGSSACVPVCNPRWDACISRCSTRGLPCVNACETSHAICVASCH